MADELKEEIRRLKSYRANGITTKQGHTQTRRALCVREEGSCLFAAGAELCERLRRRRRQQRQFHSEALRNACTVEVSEWNNRISVVLTAQCYCSQESLFSQLVLRKPE